MENTPVIFLAGNQVHGRPELEEKFNKWYNEEHVPLVLKAKGVIGATRYKIITPGADQPKYLAIYQFENEQAFGTWYYGPGMVAAHAQRKETWSDQEWETKWRGAYQAIKVFQKQ